MRPAVPPNSGLVCDVCRSNPCNPLSIACGARKPSASIVYDANGYHEDPWGIFPLVLVLVLAGLAVGLGAYVLTRPSAAGVAGGSVVTPFTYGPACGQPVLVPLATPMVR
jgi:hypothetical protein